MRPVGRATRLTTATLNLAELSALLGRQNSNETSHNRGDPRRVLQKTRGATYPSTVWLLCSRAKRGAPLVDHFKSVAEQVSALPFQSPDALPVDREIDFVIGVLTEIPFYTVHLNSECLAILALYRAEFSVTIYEGSDGGH
jgi:hypothetical protein